MIYGEIPFNLFLIYPNLPNSKLYSATTNESHAKTLLYNKVQNVGE